MIVAAATGGGIYRWQTTPRPSLNIYLTGTDLGLSWIVPSTKFTLQHNPDLSSSNWMDVTASAALNYTNLHYEVTVPAEAGAMFYRLVARSAGP
jgi:hypothetical protein